MNPRQKQNLNSNAALRSSAITHSWTSIFVLVSVITSWHTGVMVSADTNLFTSSTSGVTNNNNENKECGQARDCAGCFSAGPTCSWCLDSSWEGVRRCFDSRMPQDSFNRPLCRSVDKNPMLANQFPDTVDFDNWQTSKLSFTITPGNDIALPKLVFKNTRDRPVDLYFLMDLTQTMKDDKEKVAEIGKDIAEALQTITSQYRIGFGSFVDKPLLPFILPKHIDNPCQINPTGSENRQCEKIYLYRNHLSLTTEIDEFIHAIGIANVSGSLDDAEGGFDALHQVASCWGSKIDRAQGGVASRKLVLYMTNSEVLPHLAGDGKLGGVVMPVDGECHLSDDGVYHDRGFDYPSVEELDQVLVQNDVTAIFATPQDETSRTYQRLADLMTGSRPTVATLEEDSSNIVSIIKEAHQTLAKNVRFTARHDPMIKVEFIPECLDADKGKTKCREIGFNESAVFSVKISVAKCYNDSQYKNQKVVISPVGLTERIEIDVTIACDCACEKEVVANATQCNGRGDLRCGVCECRDNWIGETCECNSESSAGLNLKCYKDGILCSGNGRCICGKCNCVNPFYGEFCEMNENKCPRAENGQPCGAHGSCKPSGDGCECEPGWMGSSCECRDENESCIEPTTRLVCSGHGTCSCDGKCLCSKTSGGWYIGDLCEICPTCGGCGKFSPFAENHVLCTEKRFEKHAVTRCNEERLNSKSVGVRKADTGTLQEYMKQNGLTNRRVCKFSVSAKDLTCYYEFIFIEQTQAQQNVTIVFQLASAGCHEPIPVWRIAVPIIAAIVLFGLVIALAWKLVNYLQEKHEAKLFEAEQKRALAAIGQRADTNPLYKSPYTEFKMPEELRASEVQDAEDD